VTAMALQKQHPPSPPPAPKPAAASAAAIVAAVRTAEVAPTRDVDSVGSASAEAGAGGGRVAPSTGTVSAAEVAVASRVEPKTAEAGARAGALSAAKAPAVAAAAAVAVVAAELTPLVSAPPESGAASADAASAAAAGAGSIFSARSSGGVGVAVEVGRCGGSNSPEGRRHTGNLSAALTVTLCATRQVLEHRYLPSFGIHTASQTTHECTNSLLFALDADMRKAPAVVRRRTEAGDALHWLLGRRRRHVVQVDRIFFPAAFRS